MDLKDLDEVDEMSDNMKKLEEATDKLSDGAGALEEGMQTYKTYLNQYLAGVAALDQGAGALESGLQVMNEKKGDLQAGATLLKESLTTLHNTLATVQLPQGSSLDLTGMESAEKQLEEDGTKLNEALTGMSTGLARMQQLAQEVGAYKTTVETQLETAKTALDAIDWAALDQAVRADSQAKADAAVEAAMQKALENYGLSADQIRAAQGEVKTAVNSALDQVSVSEEAKAQIQKAKDALEAIPTITIPEVSFDTEKADRDADRYGKTDEDSGRLRHHARYGIQDCYGIAAGITDRTCRIADRNSTVTGRQQSVRSRYGSVRRRNPAAVSGIRSAASGERTTFFHRNCPDRRFGYDDLRHGQPASGTGQI